MASTSFVDLDSQLCLYIRNLGSDSADCGLGFVPAGGQLSLQMDPGSKIIQSYFNGTEDLAINFELSLNNQSYQEAREILNPIAQALETLREGGIQSANRSFLFDHIEITSRPFNQIIDVSGNIFWTTTFTAYVTTTKGSN